MDRGKKLKLGRPALLALALLLAACGDEEVPPPSAGADAGQSISVPGGVITVRLPKAWRQVSPPDEPLEYEAERYATSLDRWARCGIMVVDFPNVQGLSQEAANERIDQMPKPGPDYISRSLRMNTSYAKAQGVRFKISTVAADGGDIEIWHGAAIVGDKLHGIRMQCDSAYPPTKLDKAEAAAFFRSIEINRP